MLCYKVGIRILVIFFTFQIFTPCYNGIVLHNYIIFTEGRSGLSPYWLQA